MFCHLALCLPLLPFHYEVKKSFITLDFRPPLTQPPTTIRTAEDPTLEILRTKHYSISGALETNLLPLPSGRTFCTTVRWTTTRPFTAPPSPSTSATSSTSSRSTTSTGDNLIKPFFSTLSSTTAGQAKL
jgi:hypothetical protein